MTAEEEFAAAQDAWRSGIHQFSGDTLVVMDRERYDELWIELHDLRTRAVTQRAEDPMVGLFRISLNPQAPGHIIEWLEKE